MAKGKKKVDPQKKTKNDPMSESKQISKRMWVSWPVFAFSVSMVVLSMISVVFPALIQSSLSEFRNLDFYSQVVDPFELGQLAIPFLAVNFILFGFGFF